jgi:hypothetical protein
MAKGADKRDDGETSKTILRIAPGKRKNFSILGNAMLQDRNVGNDALGVLAFILSHPEDWHSEIEWLCRERKLGRDKARRIIAEVISPGYCHRSAAAAAPPPLTETAEREDQLYMVLDAVEQLVSKIVAEGGEAPLRARLTRLLLEVGYGAI